MKIFRHKTHYNIRVQIKKFKFHNKNIIIQLINNLDFDSSKDEDQTIGWKSDISDSAEGK